METVERLRSEYQDITRLQKKCTGALTELRDFLDSINTGYAYEKTDPKATHYTESLMFALRIKNILITKTGTIFCENKPDNA